MEDHEREIAKQAAQTKDIPRRKLLLIIGLAFLLCLFGGGAAGLASWLTLKGAAEDGTLLAQQIKKECEAPGLTDPQLAQFCPKADEVVKDAPAQVKTDNVPGPQGPKGDPGTNAAEVTNAQILVAVTQYCADTGKCTGKDGSTPTPAQVAAAVASYCTANGDCRGPQGDPGSDGQNGSPGSDGKDAPAVTQAQLANAVETYCANNTCRGPAGQDGAQGPTGVVAVTDDCAPAPEGQVIADVIPTYDEGTRTVTITCTYKKDETGGLLGLPEGG